MPESMWVIMKEHENNPEPILLKVGEAAYGLSMSLSATRRLIKNGSLKTVRPTIGTVRISRAELERFVKEVTESSHGAVR